MTIKVRKAKVDDVDQIHKLLLLYSVTGELLPRSREEIRKNCDVFFISEENNTVAGCASLEIFTTDLAEVRSLAVDPNFTKSGHGRLLVKKIEDEANSRGLTRLIALTYVPHFFQKLGFKITSMENLPEKVFGVCISCPNFNNCDEIAMIKDIV